MKLNILKESGKSLYICVYEAIVEEIQNGYIKNGDKLPTRRQLAKSYNISENTVDTTYRMLQDTGYAISIPRQGYFVSFKTTGYNSDIPWERDVSQAFNLSPNGIDTEFIDRSPYSKLIKRVAYDTSNHIFSPAEKGGEFALRDAISRYLYSFRNIKCSPWQIIIGAGKEYLLSMLTPVLGDDINYVIEDPCYTRTYNTLQRSGRKITGVQTSLDGSNIDDLYKSNGDIFYTMPYHHYPTGYTMPIEKRKQVIKWACQKDGRYIIEDNFDCEIIWKSPLESIFELDENNKVIYLGSFERSIGHGFQISYMVLPEELLNKWKRTHRFYYALSTKLQQNALAQFINKGYFVDHYKRLRRLYKDKREIVKSILDETFGDRVKISNNSDSTYVLATFDIGLNNDEIFEKAIERGVKIHFIQNFILPPKEQLPTIMFGVGSLPKEKLKKGMQEFCKAFDK